MFDRCQLLASVRVLDVGGPESDGVGRLLADLGADVLKVEPPGGAAARAAKPTVSGSSVPFTLNNANKRAAVLDPADADDRERFIELVAGADILIDGGVPGGTDAFGTSSAELADRFPQLVALQVTDFGASGPHASWQATDAVLYAMSTGLSRSGPTTGQPVLPPYGIASATAAVQAAFAALVAHYHRLRCGTGDYIDFSRSEGVLQSLDPPFGSEGQAAVGLKASHELWRGRPRNQQLYPTFPCVDGFVRICVLSPRQWHGMWAWLGEPEAFSDPRFEVIGARYAAADELNAAIADLVAPQTMESLVAEGQRRGVPIAAVLRPAEALASDHFRSVGALTETDVADGTPLAVPTGPFVVDGVRAGIVRACPAVGADEPTWVATRAESANPTGQIAERPFEGLRILDLGVIVAGGELGRLFADLGAEVIKVESAEYPDGLRQTLPGQLLSRSWALTHRNESGLGLDLRHPEGAAIFRRLVSESDAVFANFKPGTLAGLGFSYDELRTLNPRIVLAESSAYGATGPWSGRMGYGPLVRAMTGVSRLWISDDPADPNFYDATTVFPDHVVGRITAVAALAALINQLTDDAGAHVHISQAEAAVNQLATTYVAEAAHAAGLTVVHDDAIHVVCPCAGDDEWCVVSVRSEQDRIAVAKVVGASELPDGATEFVDAVSAWTAGRDKTDVVALLQDAGVPAGPMYRAVDVLADPQVTHRGLYTEMVHPLLEAPLTAETHCAPFRHIADPTMRPAPMPGEHTREIARTRLGLDDDETERLIAESVLFSWTKPDEEPRSST
ncbi:CoA transferase [Mycolicibacterium sp. P9-64]|uniref:CoA transferase n=1 Tax=Mycolicibacterium sp. P9-64 TaxID=2024612 RepID=UPI0011EE41A9|nr:CoA transferase [Mycolicibacterium sp. P9-64]KAA0082020.1 CoA transferase [Mycolicibacterium sp. P9-64]